MHPMIRRWRISLPRWRLRSAAGWWAVAGLVLVGGLLYWWRPGWFPGAGVAGMRPRPGAASDAGGPAVPPAAAAPGPARDAREAPERPAAASGARPPAEAQAAVPEFRWPLRGVVTAGWGWTYSRTMADWRWHLGIDISAAPGEPVRAAAPGRVTRVRRSGEWGAEVVIDHGGGWTTRYAGVRDVRVAPGAQVQAGEVVAAVGGEGLAEVGDGSHLHFEIAREGRAVDPRRHLP